MRKLLGIMTVISSLLLVLCTTAFSQGYSAQRIITVNGDSEIKVEANLAIIRIAIQITDPSLVDAKKKLADKMVELSRIAGKFDVNPDDMQSDFMEISRSNRGGSDQEYFHLSKKINISFKDLSKYEEFVSDLAFAGFTTLNNTEYRVTELRKYKDEARLMAVKAATSKASDMAQQVGAKIGNAVNIVENSSKYDTGYNRYPGQQSSQYPNPFNASTTVSPDFITSSDNTTPRKISVTASVTVSYELE